MHVLTKVLVCMCVCPIIVRKRLVPSVQIPVSFVLVNVGFMPFFKRPIPQIHCVNYSHTLPFSYYLSLLTCLISLNYMLKPFISLLTYFNSNN